MNFSQKLVHFLQERFILQVSTLNKRIKRIFSLKMNKSTGADKISFNMIKNCFGELSDTLKYVFDLSLQTGIFPDPLKIKKVTPVFKSGDLKEISNYRSISVLPCFLKLLELMRCNRLYSYLANEKILYSKQFGFVKSHSTEYAISELADQIHESLESNS